VMPSNLRSPASTVSAMSSTVSLAVQVAALIERALGKIRRVATDREVTLSTFLTVQRAQRHRRIQSAVSNWRGGWVWRDLPQFARVSTRSCHQEPVMARPPRPPETGTAPPMPRSDP
jgi:hypothetical protein